MDRATIKTLATNMLQNRSAVSPAYLDEVLDIVYGHTLVDAAPSLARRGVELLVTQNGVSTYQLSDEWRALDADYALLDDGTRIPVYTSDEAWLQLEAAVGASPSRLKLYYDDPRWFVEVQPTPTGATNINIPGTFYRGVLADAGTPNGNEALAVMYGTVAHIALIAGLSDIVTAAQTGMKTQLSMLRSQTASERWTPTQLPPRRDF